jgi:hypothetical protein
MRSTYSWLPGEHPHVSVFRTGWSMPTCVNGSYLAEMERSAMRG